jgi:hypothetical protein
MYRLDIYQQPYSQLTTTHCGSCYSTLHHHSIHSLSSNTASLQNTAIIMSRDALFCALGSPEADLSDVELQATLDRFLATLGPRQDVMVLPPDYTRHHSYAGKLTQMICEYYRFIDRSSSSTDSVSADNADTTVSTQTTTTETNNDTPTLTTPVPTIQILPALGTHAPMTSTELHTMFGSALATKEPSPFLVHQWRHDVVTIGQVPADLVATATLGRLTDRTWPVQLNRHVWDKRRSLWRQQHQQQASSVSTTTSPPLVLSIGQVVPHEV